MEDLESLYRQADELFRQHRIGRAEALYRTALARDERPVHALQMLSAIAFDAGKTDEAVAHSERILEFEPTNLQVMLAIGQARESQHRYDDAISIYRRAVRAHPGNALSYLFLGAALQTNGDGPSGLKAYGFAFGLNKNSIWLDHRKNYPPAMTTRSRRARAAIAGRLRQIRAETLDALETELGADLSLVRDAFWYNTDDGPCPYRHPLQRPEGIYVRGLDPVAVFDKERFEWSDELEAQYPNLRTEILTHLDIESGTHPYVEDRTRETHPLRHLSRNPDWSSVHLYQHGLPNEAALKRFPGTAKAVAGLPHTTRADQPLEIFISILKPGTHIPPHFGLNNAGVTVHLPILIPDGDLGIRVGAYTHVWKEGELFFFDDAFEHEAWNRTGELRIVLIFEVWNPEMAVAERTALDTLAAKRADWVEAIRVDDFL